MSAHYSTREVAKLVNLPERRIRALARAGLVGRHDAPRAEGRRHLRFDFRDLQVLRTASKLLSAGLPPARVQRALSALQRQTPVGQPLSGTQLHHESGRVVASNGASQWDLESGQCVLRYGADRQPEVAPIPLVAPVVPPAPEGKNADDTESADEWFDLALENEDTAPQQAYEYYLKALACDPEHVEATINIGRLCSASGDARRAAAYFRLAARVDPAHPVAHFNLAVTLHDMGDLTGAVNAYRIALLHDPHFADAHYNLATLLEQQGEKEEALQHYNAYRNVLNRPPQI